MMVFDVISKSEDLKDKENLILGLKSYRRCR